MRLSGGVQGVDELTDWITVQQHPVLPSTDSEDHETYGLK